MLSAYWEKRVEAHVDAASSAALLARESINSQKWTQALADFNELYHGRLVMFEDEIVCKGMVKFNAKLQEFKNAPVLAKEALADASRALAPIIHDGHRISAGRAVATGLTAIFETDCRRGWRLLFGARPAAPAAWFRALGR